VLNLTFDFGGPEAPAGATPKAAAALAAEAEADSTPPDHPRRATRDGGNEADGLQFII
jgi:hypothetical protein